MQEKLEDKLRDKNAGVRRESRREIYAVPRVLLQLFLHICTYKEKKAQEIHCLNPVAMIG